ncbi:MAG: DHHA2 domain-containing protein, partial [Succinivibrio sp.]
DASPRDLIFRDFKDFDMGGSKIGIGQLELISLSMVTPELKKALVEELSAVKAEGRHSAVLVLTDIMKEGSELLVCSDDENKIIEALGCKKADVMWMPGVMSRKKQVVPPLQNAFKA